MKKVIIVRRSEEVSLIQTLALKMLDFIRDDKKKIILLSNETVSIKNAKTMSGIISAGYHIDELLESVNYQKNNGQLIEDCIKILGFEANILILITDLEFAMHFLKNFFEEQSNKEGFYDVETLPEAAAYIFDCEEKTVITINSHQQP